MEDALERGEIVYFPVCPVELPSEETLDRLREELPRQLRAKNVSLHPESGRLRGVTGDDGLRRVALEALTAHGARVRGFLRATLPSLTRGWTVGTSSFRPIEERGRDLSAHASNERIHIDAGAYGATDGDRILRFFVNVNPAEDRVWSTKGTLSHLYACHGVAAGIAAGGRPGGAGEPEDTGAGRPGGAGPGRPDGTGPGRPEGTGPGRPESVGPGRPGGAGAEGAGGADGDGVAGWRPGGAFRPDGAVVQLERTALDRLRRLVLRGVARLGLAEAVLADSSPYDRLMRRFHNYMKDTPSFQALDDSYRELRFPPFSAWMALTDMVSHASVSGQHALVDTFVLRLAACRHPHLAPINILRRRP